MAHPRIQHALISGTLEKHIAEVKGKKYAHLVMQKSKQVYRYLVKSAPKLSDDNPFSDFFLLCLCLIAPYQADDKKIDPQILGDGMLDFLEKSINTFKRINLKTKRGRAAFEKFAIEENQHKEKGYSFEYKIEEKAYTIIIEKSPAQKALKKIGVMDLYPQIIRVAEAIIKLQNGKLEHKLGEKGETIFTISY